MAKKPALSPEDARAEALSTALSTIERKYGKGAVMKLSDDVQVDIPVIPTGSIGLDLALGVGGHSARARHGNFRARILGQNHAHPAHHR